MMVVQCLSRGHAPDLIEPYLTGLEHGTGQVQCWHASDGYGLPDAFWDWAEEEKAKHGMGGKALPREVAYEWYDEWIELGEPTASKAKTLRDHRRRGGGRRGMATKKLLVATAGGVIVISYFTDKAIALIDALTGSRAYGMLMRAIRKGDVGGADYWANELYLEIVEAGLPMAALNFLEWWQTVGMLGIPRYGQSHSDADESPPYDGGGQRPESDWGPNGPPLEDRYDECGKPVETS